MKSTPQVPPQWEWHYRTLSRLRDVLARERDEDAASFRVPIEHGGEDRGDLAEDQREHAELLARLRSAEAELAEIEAALARIREGTYGTCEITGDAIGRERLRAIPWTRWSAPAAARVEQAGALD